LEKCWAKIYGSYYKIKQGLTREVMHDLTGAPAKYLFMDDPSLWDTIKEGMQRNWAMTAGSRNLTLDGLTIP